MKDDPIIQEAYRVKDELARRYGNDVRRLAKAIREEQDKCWRKVVSPPLRHRDIRPETDCASKTPTETALGPIVSKSSSLEITCTSRVCPGSRPQ